MTLKKNRADVTRSLIKSYVTSKHISVDEHFERGKIICDVLKKHGLDGDSDLSDDKVGLLTDDVLHALGLAHEEHRCLEDDMFFRTHSNRPRRPMLRTLDPVMRWISPDAIRTVSLWTGHADYTPANPIMRVTDTFDHQGAAYAVSYWDLKLCGFVFPQELTFHGTD